jgi:hypothetical protein
MPERKFNERKIIKMYIKDRYTLRRIAKKLHTNHHTIKRKLLKNEIEVNLKNIRKRITQKVKKKMSSTRKSLFKSGKIISWQKGKKMSKEHILKNMRGHLRFDVSLEWLSSFKDIEKLKFLNKSISKKRNYNLNFNTEFYISFIERFYYDKKFNYLFDTWTKTKDRWIRPSLDHIEPRCNGGRLDVLDNLKFISWLENRTKVDMSQTEWDLIKERINEYF